MNVKCTAWPNPVQLYGFKCLKIVKTGRCTALQEEARPWGQINPVSQWPASKSPHYRSYSACCNKLQSEIHTQCVHFILISWVLFVSMIVFVFMFKFSYVECSRLEVGSESEKTLLSDRVLFVTVICGCVCVFTCVYVFIYVECSRAAVNQRGHRCLTASFPPICSQGSTLQLAPVIKSAFFVCFFRSRLYWFLLLWHLYVMIFHLNNDQAIAVENWKLLSTFSQSKISSLVPW